MSFKLNKQQQDIINCFFNNGICFVNASAGTGKTSTIIELYLKLLEKGEKVSNIVVITFTKAAANEMLLRIRLKVRAKIKEIDNKSIKEKQYWQNIYRDILTNAKISTINAFANSIAMENAMLLSIPPNAKILEDNSDIYETLKEEVLNTLKEVDYTEKLRSIYRIYTEESKNDFAGAILNFLLKIKPRLTNIENFEKKALEILNIKEEYSKIYNNICLLNNFIINDDGPENNTIKTFKVLVENTTNYIAKLSNLESIKNIEENEFDKIKYIISEVENQPNRCGNKNESFKNAITELKALYSTLFLYIDIERNRENYLAVVNFIKDAYNHFEEVKKSLGVYTHEDIMYKAIEALEDKNISKSIRDNISTLILDEAQDTSSLQFSFINLIVFGKSNIDRKIKTDKKLMVVGDRKQSIYRFRNANFKDFINSQHQFNDYVKYLKDNYRSNSMLIEFFNDLFQNTVFTDDEIEYTDEDNLTPNKKTKDKAISILVLNKNCQNTEPNFNIEYRTLLESFAIAKYIKKNYDNNYKNVVILLQNFKRLNVYLKALSYLQIPYYIDGGNGFYERQEIVLIKTFLEYLVLRDHAKLPTLLRSEFFDIDIGNLSDFLFTLSKLGYDINDYFPKAIYDEDKHNKILEIAKSKPYYNKLKEAKELLNSIESKISMLNASEIIETICNDTNFYNYLMTMEDAELSYSNIEKLKTLASDFENQTGNNAYDFVLNIQNANTKEPYSSIPKLSVEAVKIMTIHKSKGLEFDNVFVAGMGDYNSPKLNNFDFIEDSPFIKLPVYYRNDYHTINCSISDEEYNKTSEQSEKRRLMYVALTRTSNNLVLSGEYSRGTSYREYINQYFNGVFKDYMPNTISEENDDLINDENIKNDFINTYTYGTAIEPKENIDANIVDINKIKEKIEDIKENKKEITVKAIENRIPSKNVNNDKYAKKHIIKISELLDNKILELESEINENYSEDYNENISFISYTDLGTIIHKMLEYFDYDKYNDEKDLYLEKVKKSVLKNNSHYNKKQLMKSLTLAFERLFENEHIKNILENNEKIVSREHTFQNFDGEILETGKIDIITKNKKGEYFILDYKVSAYSKEKLDHYQSQLNKYKNMFQKTFKIDENDIKTDIIFLK
ncbi:UvrD-helicase domain-containing protein [Brachyspira pulli]|uniref:UvrD-helicase domain-containing protein n=1 Tax=Brachyspira pulli TaxID=310721 RepID=UPI0030065EF0